MQPIERYGVVALLFLVATFTAVLVMGEKTALGAEPGAKLAKSRQGALPETDAGTQKGAKRLRLTSGIQAAPLKRDTFPDERARQEQEAAQAQRQRFEERARLLERQEQAARQAQLVAAGEPTSRGGFARGDQASTSYPRGQSEVESFVPQQNKKSLRQYRVKSGDTLGEIALAELGTSKVWKLITEVNPGLTPAKLIVNRNIYLPSEARVASALAGRAMPASTGPKKSASKTSSSVASAGSVTYTVAAGESLWRIAQRQLGDGNRFHEIVKLNPGINPNVVREGQKLKLPSGARAVKSKAQSRPVAADSIAQVKTTKRTGRVR